MQSDTFNWGAAILLSLLVHSMMFMNRGAQMGVESAPVLQMPLITRLSFNKPSEQPVLDKPSPVKRQKARPVEKTEIKKILVKPVKKEPIIQRIEPVEINEAVRQLSSLPQVQGQQTSPSEEGLLQRKRQQYLQELLSHIESFKYYPRAARRRSVEGNVKISFLLRDDGFYEQLMLDGEQAVLVKATRQALESAMPLPVPPKNIDMSRQIEFTMAYSLTR